MRAPEVVAFLKEVERWHELLASHLARRQAGLTERDLDIAVRQTIERVVCRRLCEERGMAELGRLLSSPDGGLIADDDALAQFVKSLTDPDRPDGRSILPADILGRVHEQLLAKVIRLTPDHQAVVEEKPAPRKASGVYYTPAAMVDRIVRQTVGKLLGEPETRTLAEVRRLRILDPACGAGAFLIGAYQDLLDWHRDWYVADGPEKWAAGQAPRLNQDQDGTWRLTVVERSRILVSHIFGVDVDPQAVRVARLALLLKALEDAPASPATAEPPLPDAPALPDLDHNVQCGNALIGRDFYSDAATLAVDDEGNRISAFDWQAAFPLVFSGANPGFDVVIGNPPWGQKGIFADEAVKRYVRSRYTTVSGIYDLFRPFVERGIQLLADGGMFGMVLPDVVLLKDYQPTRRLLLDALTITAIDWWGRAFSSAVIDTATIVGIKAPAPQDHRVRVAVHHQAAPSSLEIPQADFRANPRHVFNLALTPEKRQILEHLKDCPKLGDFFEIHEGVHSGNVRAELFVNRRVDNTCRELLFGRTEISPYWLQWHGRYLRLGVAPSQRTSARYANLGRPEWYNREKLLVRRTGDRIVAAVDRDQRYASNNFFIVFPAKPCSPSLDGLCTLLNSRFLTWYFRTVEPRKGRVFAELKIKHLRVFPLPAQVLDLSGDRAFDELAWQRARLAAQLAAAQTLDDRADVQYQVDVLDRQIDRLVYEMYGLAAEAAAIVEA